jgi:hypothetical protein
MRLDAESGARQEAAVVEVDEMGGNPDAPRERRAAEPDVTQYCPSCGALGQWQKCKLICINPRCSVRIILACVD